MAVRRCEGKPAIRLLRRSTAPGAAALVVAWLGAGCAQGDAQTISSGTGSAKLDKPLALAIAGGSCESDGKGSVGANFGNALAFNIGPATVGMPDMSKAPYRGPGTYRRVIISGYPKKGSVFAGLGTVVVNADRQTGTFVTDDGEASGSWNCGALLK